jgi:hypothetical protein
VIPVAQLNKFEEKDMKSKLEILEEETPKQRFNHSHG